MAKGANLHLRKIEPITDNQEAVFEEYREGNNLILHGCAGTGKTFVALYLALKDVFRGNYETVLVVRSCVPTREIGYLPGTLEEKQRIYELPYMAMCAELFERGDAYDALKKAGMIDFMTTSFVRGLTLRNCVVIVDEAQNMTSHELDSVITRLAENSRLILCGDTNQNDLNNKRHEQSGMAEIMHIMSHMNGIECVEFFIEDIVRSGFVKEYIETKSRLGY